MTGGPWRGTGPDADGPHRYTPVTRLHVGASDASEGLSLAVESYGARHGIELLERVGAACAVWFRRNGRLVLARQVGAVAGEPDVAHLLDVPLADVFADVRRLGGALEVPARLPDGSPWLARFVPLPEGAIAAVWVEPRPTRSVPSTPVVEAKSDPVDPGMPRRLMSIASHVANLADGSGKLRERAITLQRAIDREAWRLLGQRGEALPVDPRAVPLSAKLEAVQQRGLALIPSHIDTTIDIPPGLARVDVPAPAVRFILEELVRNSVAAIGEGAGRIRIRGGVLDLEQDTVWHDRNMAPGTYVFIEVTDTGEGLDDDHVASLVTGGVAGSLQAVRGLTVGWGGGLRIRSSPGRGTIVQAAFPAKGVQRATRSATPRAAPEVPRGRRCALVVMGPGQTRARVVEGLGATGLDVVVARDSNQAVERFRSRANMGGVALLVVADVLPDGAGFDLARRLREIAPILPVVLTTDNPVDEVEDDLPDLAPGRVVPQQYAGRMAVGAAKLLLPRVRTRQG